MGHEDSARVHTQSRAVVLLVRHIHTQMHRVRPLTPMHTPRLAHQACPPSLGLGRQPHGPRARGLSEGQRAPGP